MRSLTATATRQDRVDLPRPAGRSSRLRPDRSDAVGGHLHKIDVALAAILVVATTAVHDVGYMLGHPFWLDESWVADSTRAGFSSVPSLTSSTPLGWSYLLRLVPFGGEQRLRLVPLAFTALAAGAAYFFGRELRLTRFGTGLLTGTAVLLSPALLVRDDLKAYTAEALASIVILVMVARIENEWRLSRLAALASVTVAGLLFTNTVIFVGVAAMGALGLECLIRREYRCLLDLAGVSATMLVLAFGVFELVDQRSVSASLTHFWDSMYLSTGHPGAIYGRLAKLAPYMGFSHLLLDAGLALAGTAVLVWQRRFALALVLPLTLVIAIVAALDRRYPFGDLRTSTYWLVMVPLLMAVGVAGLSRIVGRRDSRLALAAVVVGIGLWSAGTHQYDRGHPLQPEDVRSQARYLESHLRPGDAVIVSYAAGWGFAYYYHPFQPTFIRHPQAANGFMAVYPQDPYIVSMPERSAADVATALAQAERQVAGTRDQGRIWIVRSHLAPVESAAWKRDLDPRRVTSIPVGPEPLLLYRPPG